MNLGRVYPKRAICASSTSKQDGTRWVYAFARWSMWDSAFRMHRSCICICIIDARQSRTYIATRVRACTCVYVFTYVCKCTRVICITDRAGHSRGSFQWAWASELWAGTGRRRRRANCCRMPDGTGDFVAQSSCYFQSHSLRSSFSIAQKWLTELARVLARNPSDCFLS